VCSNLMRRTQIPEMVMFVIPTAKLRVQGQSPLFERKQLPIPSLMHVWSQSPHNLGK